MRLWLPSRPGATARLTQLPLALVAVLAVVTLGAASPSSAASTGSVADRTSAGQAATSAQVVAPDLRAQCVAGASACPIRITFAPGWYSGQAHSYLSGMSATKWFVVHARANQSMIVLVEGAGPTRGIVYYPNGQQNGQPGGRVFDDTLPVSGNYKIRVTEDSMAEAWHGSVTVVVVIF